MAYKSYIGFMAAFILAALIVTIGATAPGVAADDDDLPPPPRLNPH